ncbi:dockerin type I domain-containing protein [Stieleria varia]|uniref:Bifunctional hemolysin/adenylate cyclase n=1 Tax=Stieleria varia TaxID=2528005 RepID=A0A5C6AZH3_9BACT|nr:dockerin type I domain-containing protein [Stieleria varia]TWU05455.1 Bifunctional hemolysin/adenylate cyclase precursor [Stieleria varia]
MLTGGLPVTLVGNGDEQRITIVAKGSDVKAFSIDHAGAGGNAALLGFSTTQSVNADTLPHRSVLGMTSRRATRDVNPALLSQLPEDALEELRSRLGIAPEAWSYDAAEKTLIFRLEGSVPTQSKSVAMNLDRTINLGVFGELELIAQATASASASNIGFQLNVGLNLDPSDRSMMINAGTRLAELNDGRGVGTAVGVAGTAAPGSRLERNRDTPFDIQYRRAGNSKVFTQKIYLRNVDTVDNLTAQDLIDDLQSALDDSGLGSLFEAVLIEDADDSSRNRLHIVAIDPSIAWMEVRIDRRLATPFGMLAINDSDYRQAPTQPATGDNRTAYPDLLVKDLARDQEYFISLDGVITLGQALQAISAQTGGLVSGSIRDQSQIVLTSDTPFEVSNLDTGQLTSHAAYDLGLLATSEFVAGNYEIASPLLNDVPLSDRVFLAESFPGDAAKKTSLSANIDLESRNVAIGGALGMIGLEATTQSNNPIKIGYGLDLELTDPGTSADDGRITLRELIQAEPLDLFSPPTLSDITVGGKIDVRGELQGVFSSTPLLTMTLNKPESGLDLLTFDTSAMDDVLKQLRSLQPQDVAAILLRVVDQWTNGESTAFLREKLPIVGSALADVADVLTKVRAAIRSVVSEVNSPAVAEAIDDVQVTIEDLPLARSEKQSIFDALQTARELLAEVRSLANTESITPTLTKLLAAVGTIRQEAKNLGIPLTPAASAAPVAAPAAFSRVPEGESVTREPSELERLVIEALDRLWDALPAANDLAKRFSDAIRRELPNSDDVTFQFDASIDDNNRPIILVGLSLSQAGEIKFDPNFTVDNFFIGADAALDGVFGVDAELGLGAKLSYDGSSPTVELITANPEGNPYYVPTHLSLKASALAKGSAAVTVGTAPVAGGDVNLRLQKSTADSNPAEIIVSLDADADGLMPVDELASKIQFEASGVLTGNLNVDLIGERADNVVTLEWDIASGEAPEFVVDESRLVGLFANFDFDLATIIIGIDEFLSLLSNTLREELDELPIIGGGLEDIGGFISDLRTKLVEPIRELFAASTIRTFADLERELHDRIFNALGDLITNEDLLDITLTADRFEIEVTLGKLYTVVDIPFDTNLPGLSMRDGSGLEVDITPTLDIGFGVSRYEGFYLINGTGNELSLQIDAHLAPETELNLDLFVLDVTASQSSDEPATGVSGSIQIDLGNQETPIGQLNQFDVRIAVDANLNLDLKTRVAGGVLPSITADLVGHWGFDTDMGGVQSPSFSLNNISLDAGRFLGEVIGPAAQKINEYLEPVADIIEILETPIPGVSQLSQLAGNGPVTLLDLALSQLDASDRESTKKFIQFLKTVQSVTELSNRISAAGEINFGSISFAGEGLTEAGWNLNVGETLGNLPGITVDSGVRSNPLATANAELDSLVAELSREPSSAKRKDQGLGLSFKVWDEPSSLIRMLLGQPIDLITWNVPELKLSFDWAQRFQIIPTPPISVEIGLEAVMEIDLSLGLSSRGLQTGNLLDGFFFGDRADVTTGDDIDELTLRLGATLAALLDLGVASAGIQGGLYGQIAANWRDPDGDGRLYFDELGKMLRDDGFECLFDLRAELTAVIRLVWQVLFAEGTIDIAEITLFETDNSSVCPARLAAHVSDGNEKDSRDFPNILPEHLLEQIIGPEPDSQYAPAGTLIIHAGAMAGLRHRGSSKDVSESFTLSNPAPGVVRVQGMGLDNTFGGVTLVAFDGGLGNDELNVIADPETNRTFSLPIVAFGGVGRDRLYGGNKEDHLFGDAGDDFLFGGDGGDQLFGGDGDDQLDGQKGDDSLWGNAGRDTLFGGDGNDTLHGGLQDDHLYGGDDFDTLYGDDGHDWIEGGAGDDPLIDGGTGNDYLVGGSGADFLLGGWGNDSLIAYQIDGPVVQGQADDDVLEGGPDDDFLCGSAGSNSLYGGISYNTYRNDLIDFDNTIPVLPGGYLLESCTSELPDSLPTPQSGSVTVRVFRDHNADHAMGSSEKFENDWEVELIDAEGGSVATAFSQDVDLNTDDYIDPTLERGIVRFDDVIPGTYSLRIVKTLGKDFERIIQTAPQPTGSDDLMPIVVAVGDAQSIDAGLIGMHLRPEIRGTVFHDINGNGRRDEGEPGLEGRNVYIDADNDGTNDSLAQTITFPTEVYLGSSKNGDFRFILKDTQPGERIVRLDLTSGVQTSPADQEIYFSNLNSNADLEQSWSLPRHYIAPNQSERMLGLFGNESTSLSLSNLPAHESLEIEFDLWIVGSWDGKPADDEGSSGPGDVWSFQVDSQTEFITTFSNLQGFEVTPRLQDYPEQLDQAAANQHAGGTGAFRAPYLPNGTGLNPLGEPNSRQAAYRMSLSVDHVDSNAVIRFLGSRLEAGETWAIDNVRVTAKRVGYTLDIDYEQSVTEIDFGISDFVSTSQAIVQTTQKSSAASNEEIEGFSSHSAAPTIMAPTLAAPAVMAAGESISTYAVSGIRFEDTDTDGVYDWSGGDRESGIAGQPVYVDLNGNAAYDAGEPYTLTNSNGAFTFQLEPGTYTVRELMPPGWTETSPSERPWGITSDGYLAEIDPETGHYTHVKPIELPDGYAATQWIGLTYDTSGLAGRLLAVGNFSLFPVGDLLSFLFEIDSITGKATLLTQLSEGIPEGDLVADFGGLHAVKTYGNAAWLVDIDTQSGQVTRRGIFHVGSEFGPPDASSLTFHNGDYWSVVYDGQAQLVQINPFTGQAKSKRPLSDPLFGSVAGMVAYRGELTPRFLFAAGEPRTGENAPAIYDLDSDGSLANLHSVPLSFSGLTWVPDRGHIVTVIDQPVDSLYFGNIRTTIVPDGKDHIEGHAGVDWIWGDNDVSYDPYIISLGDDDELIGGAGADYLRGDLGNDILWGKTHEVAAASPTSASENDDLDGGEGTDTVVSWLDADQTLTNGNISFSPSLLVSDSLYSIEHAELRASSMNSQGRTLDASAFTRGNVKLVGGGGDDTLIGSPQNDDLEGGEGNDSLSGGSGADRYLFTVPTSQENDVIRDTDGIDTLDFGRYDDSVNVFLNRRMMLTGTRNLENLDWDSDPYGIENVVGGGGDDWIEGNDGANRLEGGDGNDTLLGLDDEDFLIGGAGNDSLDGGNDRDVFFFSDVLGVDENDIVSGGNGRDLLDFSSLSGQQHLIVDLDASTTVASHDGRTVRWKTKAITDIEDIVGTSGDDQFYNGIDGNRISGGDGDDVYYFRHLSALDWINEFEGQGRDRIDFSLTPASVSLSIDLSSQVLAELNQAGTAIRVRAGGDLEAIEDVVGGQGDDVIRGSSRDNHIDGWYGSDQIHGELGDDRYIISPDPSNRVDTFFENAGGGSDTISFAEHYADRTDPIIVELYGGTASIAGVPRVTLDDPQRFENAIGGGGNDTLLGNDGNNRLVGGDGNDRFSGRGGNDRLMGGAGDDRYAFESLRYVQSGGSNQYQVIPENDVILDPTVVLDEFGVLVLDADGRPIPSTNSGNDTIDYVDVPPTSIYSLSIDLGNSLPRMSEYYAVPPLPPQGTVVNPVLAYRWIDRTYWSWRDQIFGTVLENIIGGPGNDTLIGNDASNIIQGGGGDDTIYGLGGNDLLLGGGGNNVIYGGRGNDRYQFNWISDSYDILVEEGGTVVGESLRVGGNDTLDFTGAPMEISFDLSDFAPGTGDPSSYRDIGILPGTRLLLKAQGQSITSPDQYDGRPFENVIVPPTPALAASLKVFDSNDDDALSSLDALLIVNWLRNNRADGQEARSLNSSIDRFDNNGDGRVTSLDALRVINELAKQGVRRQQLKTEPMNHAAVFQGDETTRPWALTRDLDLEWLEDDELRERIL